MSSSGCAPTQTGGDYQHPGQRPGRLADGRRQPGLRAAAHPPAHSDPFFSSTATNLINGIGGYSVAYLNTLVSLALSPNTVADGSPGGAAVGGLTITSLLAGSYIPPVFTPLDAQGDDADFSNDLHPRRRDPVHRRRLHGRLRRPQQLRR